VTATATRTRTDIDRQRQHDSRWPATQDLLVARMAAVLAAQRALAGRQAGAVYALRASLIDLAAVSEALASDMRSASR
jgi:hypothetical protein